MNEPTGSPTLNSLDAATTVRDLIRTHPEAFAVLLGHGMCEDCKANPPTVPLRHFADKHCGGDVDGLITELNTAINAVSP